MPLYPFRQSHQSFLKRGHTQSHSAMQIVGTKTMCSWMELMDGHQCRPDNELKRRQLISPNGQTEVTNEEGLRNCPCKLAFFIGKCRTVVLIAFFLNNRFTATDILKQTNLSKRILKSSYLLNCDLIIKYLSFYCLCTLIVIK